jgi:hypothetical protein
MDETRSCSIDLTCLSLPCNNLTQPVLFKPLACDGQCAADRPSIEDVYTDLNGVCCPLRSLDCGGICNGTSAISNTTSGARHCCPPDAIVV